MNRIQSLAAVLLTSAATLGSAQAHGQTQDLTVVEYYSTSTALYFLTGRPNEQALLDGLPHLFIRTGKQFPAASTANSRQQPICRYMIDIPDSQWKTHFYGLPSDCTWLEGVIAEHRLTNFHHEGLDFAVAPPVNGACPAGFSVPVYRFFRPLTPVNVTNHRYAVSSVERQEMQQRGWVDEGLVFCLQSATAATARPSYPPSSTYQGRCIAPRSGNSPVTGNPYPDRPGSFDDETRWLRAWSDETYLWYREIPLLDRGSYTSRSAYFSDLKTHGYVVNGEPKDQFHFTEPTTTVEARQMPNPGTGGPPAYGIQWATLQSAPPRDWRVSIVDPGSPADLAGLKRGDQLLSVDGIDFINGARTQADINTLNAALFPQRVGETHHFVFRSPSGTTRNVSLTTVGRIADPVPVSGVLDTASGRVGYLAFTTFSPYISEQKLVNAIAGLQQQNVRDLVLDLRYNGGGLLAVSAQLGYMIAGPERTRGKLFERSKFNDKLPNGLYGNTRFPFYDTTLGFSLTAGQALPTLNLPRVYILTSARSCSASEALINGLRGVDVEVILIGGQTCGKPYGFYPTDNCGTTYYTIQMTGVNHKNEGDFIHGFAPTCAASDDLSQPLGHPQEGQLAAALAYRSTGQCLPAQATGSTKAALNAGDGPALDLPLAEQSKLLTPPPAQDQLKTFQPITPRAPVLLTP